MPAPDHKLVAGLKARCALVGAALEESTDDRDRPVFILVKGATTLRMATLDDVASWLRLAEWVRARWGAAA